MPRSDSDRKARVPRCASDGFFGQRAIDTKGLSLRAVATRKQKADLTLRPIVKPFLLPSQHVHVVDSDNLNIDKPTKTTCKPFCQTPFSPVSATEKKMRPVP